MVFHKLFVTSLFINFFLLGFAWGYRCDYDYQIEGGWMKLHRIPANWEDAKLRCKLEGAVLASPVTPALSRAMTGLMKHKKLLRTPVYTDINAQFSKGDYTSSDGVPLSKIPHKWSTGEPNNFQDQERCIFMNLDGTITDVTCSYVYPYICYKENTGDTDVFISECGFDPAYKLDHRTGSCYKFHTVPRPWSEAYMTCMAEEGHLAIINSETEAEVIKELFAMHPANSMVGNFWKDCAFVGFRNMNKHKFYSDWRTIDGKTLSEAGYDRFAPGQPDNPGIQFCGAVFRNGFLDNATCDAYVAFVCEKKPATPCNETIYDGNNLGHFY